MGVVGRLLALPFTVKSIPSLYVQPSPGRSA